MADNLATSLAGVEYKKMDPYKARLMSNAYATNRDLAVRDLTEIQTHRGKLSRAKGIPPKAFHDIDTIAGQIERIVGARTNTGTAMAAPVRNNATAAAAAAPARNNAAAAAAAAAAPARNNAAAAPELVPAPCPTLYDPCTREVLPDFATLEKRIRQLRRTHDIKPVGLFGLTNATSNYDFLMGPFSDKTISLDDLVSFRLGEGGQVGSDIYEVLSRMFVFFGGIAGVNPQQGGNYKFMKKFEAAAPQVYATPREAFEAMTCKATSVSGISDITLVRAEGARAAADVVDKPYCESDCVAPDASVVQTYLMSVKWYKKEKNAEHYDLEKLRVAADLITPAERKPVEIVVFLKSKADFERAHQRAYRQYVRHIGKTFFGWDEDVKPFLQDIRRQIFEEAELRGVSPATVLEERYFVAGSKPTLGLQLHQEIITQSVCNTIDSSTEDNRYLIGVLPRGGKTYIAGGIIREYMQRKEPRSFNVLWLTAAPTETRTQVGRDLIQKFQDFKDFDFIDVRDTAELRDSAKPFRFFFCSTQLLTQAAASTVARRNRHYLQRLLTATGSLGLIFYDEAHKTAVGTKTKEEIDKILEAYSAARMPLIFLTATYYNILFEYKILLENTFVWDYTDVLKTRGLATASEQEDAIQNLKDRFRNPALITDILERRQRNGESIESMGKPYLEFPELYFISADFQEEALERFSTQAAYRPDAGFSMKTVFAVRADATMSDIRTAEGSIRADAYRVFENTVNPRNMVSLLTPGAEGFGDAEEGGAPLAKEARAMLEPSLLGRINALSRTAESRFRLDENPTLMMFMPTGGQGSRIYFTLCAWASLLLAHPWWRARYEVACVVDAPSLTAAEQSDLATLTATGASGIHILRDDPKQRIIELERQLHCSDVRKGLVVLAGQKLSMGVSLPCTDVVFLFNDSKSPDDIIQKMYRALTPSIGKRAAFVVDLNPVRSFAAIYGYTRVIGTAAQTTSDILGVMYDTYSWDADVFDLALTRGDGARPQSFQNRLRELFAAAESDPEYRIHEDFGGIEKKVAENIKQFVDKRLLATLTEYVSERRSGGGPLTIELRDGSTAKLRGGQLVISIPRPAAGGAGASAEEAPATDEIVIENFVEAIRDFVKYLAMTSRFSSLEEAIEEYATNTNSYQRNINELLLSRGAITRADPRITEVLTQTIRELSKHSRGIDRMFGDTKAKIDEPSVRKDSVLKIIHQRLTPRKKQKEEKGEVFTPIEFVEEMLDKLPAEVWKNPDLKWLDPANGIGNFPVVAFYRLDEGLKEIIPVEAARKKHIIEKMLFMAEIQSNNSRIARNIFSKLCSGCTPNIWTVAGTGFPNGSLDLTSAKLTAHGWPERFDIIMGNPPFNSGGLSKGTGFWVHFVRKAFELIKKDGYIVLTHPPGWRKFYDPEERENQGKLWHDIRSNRWKLLYLRVSNKRVGHFPPVDYYVLQAEDSRAPIETRYNCIFNDITTSGSVILNQPFIPNLISKVSLSIINKLFSADGDDINIIYTRKGYNPTHSRTSASDVPLYHYIDRTGKKTYLYNRYSDTPDYITQPKVLMTYSGAFETGKLLAFYTEDAVGTTNQTIYMPTTSKSQGEKLVRFFNSDIITFLMKITQYSDKSQKKNEFKILNQLKMPPSSDVYALTAEESALIRQIVGSADEAEANENHSGGARLRSRRGQKTRRRRRS